MYLHSETPSFPQTLENIWYHISSISHINNFIQLKQNLELIMLPPTFISSYHDESSVSKIEYKTIGKTDMVVSTLSFGASSLGGVFRKTDDQESGT